MCSYRYFVVCIIIWFLKHLSSLLEIFIIWAKKHTKRSALGTVMIIRQYPNRCYHQLGIAISSKIHKSSVKRNLIKRILYAMLYRYVDSLLSGHQMYIKCFLWSVSKISNFVSCFTLGRLVLLKYKTIFLHQFPKIILLIHLEHVFVIWTNQILVNMSVCARSSIWHVCSQRNYFVDYCESNYVFGNRIYDCHSYEMV